MACSMWEEVGLLYSSDELSEQDKEAFIEHIQKCSECSSEYEWYLHGKKEFFNNDVLCESPSVSCDAEILRVCSDARKKYTGIASLPMFFRKSVVSVTLFLITFTIAGYIAFQMDTSNGQEVASEETAPDINTPKTDVLAEKDPAVTDDSLSDSINGNNTDFPKTKGNLNMNGVVPVELHNK